MIKLPKTARDVIVKMDVKYWKDLERVVKSGEPADKQKKLALDAAITFISSLGAFHAADLLREIARS